MIVNPGLRRFVGKTGLGGARRTSTFLLDSNTSLIASHSAGSPTPTTTRATVATVVDFEGRLVTVPSGCARDQGGRFVQNLVATSSENFTAVGWGNVGGTVTVGYGTPPAGYASANRFVTTITGQRVGQFGTVGVIAGHTYRVTFMVKSNTTPVSYNILTQPTYGVDVQVPITITTDWTKVSAQWVCAGVQTSYALWSTSASDISCTGALFEEVTGQSNQNPSEYVSVGVLSAPYHGWGADGCKWFTYQNGNTVASNVVAEAQGAAITPDGYLSEPAGTNLLTWSNDLSNAAWVKNVNGTGVSATVTANYAVGPSGEMTANRVQLDRGAGTNQSVDFARVYNVSGTGNKNSLYVKSNTGANQTVCLSYPDSGISDAFVATPVWTLVSGGGGSYYQISSQGGFGTAVVDILVAECQSEATIVSSRIRTTTVAVTRNADLDTYVTAGNIPASGAFVIAGEFTSNISGGSTNRIQLSCGSDLNNYIEVGGLSDSTFRFTRNIAASATQALIAHTPVAGTTYKWCVRYSTVTGLDVWLNGTKGTNSATTTQPILGTNIFYGARLDSLLQPYAALANTTIYATDLSDSQCAALSS